jgi:hypothetical protein
MNCGWTVFSSQQGWESGLCSVLNVSVVHLATHLVGTGSFYPGAKWLTSEADRSSPCSVEVKNGGTVPLVTYMSSWPGA